MGTNNSDFGDFHGDFSVVISVQANGIFSFITHSIKLKILQLHNQLKNPEIH